MDFRKSRYKTLWFNTYIPTRNQKAFLLFKFLFFASITFSSEQMIISVLCSKTVQPSKQNKNNRGRKTDWQSAQHQDRGKSVGWEVYFISRAAFCYAICNSRTNTNLTKCRIHILAHKLEFNVSIQQMLSCFQLAGP